MILYYVHDPMCSWCWAFRPVWQALQSMLPSAISVTSILGGLAADSQTPMSLAMRRDIQQHWRVIQKRVPRTKFNFDFWDVCEPKRSTYPACRAVIAAKYQGAAFEDAMILAIQQAYYLYAQNPSDDDVLMACASKLGLDIKMFEHDFYSQKCEAQLMDDVRLSRDIGAEGFPNLILFQDEKYQSIRLDYNQPEPMLAQIIR